MTAIPLLGLGAETPVEGQPLLTVEVVTDEMGRSALRRNLDSLSRDFYCRCICEPLNKLKRKLPMSAIKIAVLSIAAIAILVCLTILEVVGAHRQGELQHALKERLKYRNFTDETLKWVMQHRAAASVIGQYGQRIFAPYVYGGGLDNNGSTSAQENSTAVNDTRGFKVLKAMGMDHVHQKIMTHMERVSNSSGKFYKTLRDTLT